ncbi:DNA-3-methyladenine glycosylase family protein [Histidinibacterium lentulum]|uniref:DNA-3-methyladenine glycosylase family protein n=1 Tax=Histidinibacterium lentulum TaxID=2480588 RepID=UPI001C85BBB1|nr:DNA-3-methyladenine glycosylase 2 family protein [Histidinibacterium lentulum]
MIQTIDDEAALRRGAAALVALEPRFAPAVAIGLPLRPRTNGFAELFSTIVYQQVSMASAQAVWTRCEAAGLTTGAALAAATDEALRAVGLTRPKQRAGRALAAADMDFAALERMPDDEALARLMALHGVGPWTAQVYALFALRRADILPAGDVALQEGARSLFGLGQRPDAAALSRMAKAWAPWRSVAARALWVYRLRETGRETVW